MSFTAEEIIRTLYAAVLGREPDPPGLKAYTSLLTENPDSLSDIAKTMFESEEHQKLIGKPTTIADHSQHGEFPLILKYFLSRSQKHGIIVDVGARGRERSNSFDLVKFFGWRAVLVEANPNLWSSIENEFAGTDFVLEKCAVSDTEGIMPFFIGVNNDVSSLTRANAASWGEVRGELQVTVQRLGAILDKHKMPVDFDVLSIDIEGYDVRVLNDLMEATQYRPEVIIIETSRNFSCSYPDDVGVNSTVVANYSLGFQTEANMILTRKWGARKTMRTTPPENFDLKSFFEGIYTFQAWEMFPGHYTQGTKNVLEHMRRLKIPARLDGLRVLDIAPWNGFFSFEAVRRGAAEVVSLGPEDPDTTGYSKTRDVLELTNCTYIRGSVYDLSPEKFGTFDIVFFLGLIYHLRHPLLALDRIYEVARNRVFVDTPIIDNVVRDKTIPESLRQEIATAGSIVHQLPMVYYTKGAETGDLYNWFMPNRLAFKDFVESSGFRIDHYSDDGDWASIAATKGQRAFRLGLEGWNEESVRG